MAIERHLIMDSEGAKPIISRVVAQGDRVYVCGITGDPVGDVTSRPGRPSAASTISSPAPAPTSRSS